VASLLALVALDASLALLGPVTILVALEARTGLLAVVGSALAVAVLAIAVLAVGLAELGLVGRLSAVAGDVAGLVAVVASTVALALEVAGAGVVLAGTGVILTGATGLGIGVGSAGALEGFMTKVAAVETLNHLYLLAMN